MEGSSRGSGRGSRSRRRSRERKALKALFGRSVEARRSRTKEVASRPPAKPKRAPSSAQIQVPEEVQALSRARRPKTAAATSPSVAVDNDDAWLEGDAQALFSTQQFDKAREHYLNVAHQHPDRTEGWLGLGAALLAQGNTAEGLENLVKGSRGVGRSLAGEVLTRIQIGSPEDWVQMADTCMQRRHPPALICALSLLEAAIRSPDAQPKSRDVASRRQKMIVKHLYKIKYKFADEAARSTGMHGGLPQGQSWITLAWIVLLILALLVGYLLGHGR